MDALLLALAGLAAASAAVFVARPFLRDPDGDTERMPGSKSHERGRLRFLEDLDRALAAVNDLEFEYRAGKLTDEEYRQLLRPLRNEAAERLRRLESASLSGADLQTEPVAGTGEIRGGQRLGRSK